MTHLELLKQTRLAEGLADGQVTALAEYAEFRTFQSGEEILAFDDVDYRLLVVLSGEVKILGVMDDEVSLVAPGSLLGEISFLDHKPRSARAVASGEVIIAKFSSDLLFKLSADDPLLEAQILYNVAVVICQKLRLATREIDASIV